MAGRSAPPPADVIENAPRGVRERLASLRLDSGEPLEAVLDRLEIARSAATSAGLIGAPPPGWDPPVAAVEAEEGPRQLAPLSARIADPVIVPAGEPQVMLITDGSPIGDGTIPEGAVTRDRWPRGIREAMRGHGRVRARIDRAEHHEPVATIEAEVADRAELRALLDRLADNGAVVVRMSLSALRGLLK